MSKRYVVQMPGRQSGAESASQINRCQRQQKWLAQVDALFGEIQQWLVPHVKQGAMRVTVTSTSMLAQFLGRPLDRAMSIQFAGHKVQLSPAAPLYPGERGYIELQGLRGKARFMPADAADGGRRWKIAYWDGSQVVHLDLTEDTFLQALLEATSD